MKTTLINAHMQEDTHTHTPPPPKNCICNGKHHFIGIFHTCIFESIYLYTHSHLYSHWICMKTHIFWSTAHFCNIVPRGGQQQQFKNQNRKTITQMKGKPQRHGMEATRTQRNLLFHMWRRRRKRTIQFLQMINWTNW